MTFRLEMDWHCSATRGPDEAKCQGREHQQQEKLQKQPVMSRSLQVSNHVIFLTISIMTLQQSFK